MSQYTQKKSVCNLIYNVHYNQEMVEYNHVKSIDWRG
jgi:hypothetical protein